MKPDVIEGFRVSRQQRRVWELQSASPEICAYRAVITFMIYGPVDAAQIGTALEAVVDRFEVLRTTFAVLQNVDLPVQCIGSSGVCWETPVPSMEQHDRALFGHLLKCHLGVLAGPVLHCAVQTVSPEEHLVGLGLPALCADAVTLMNIVREVLEALSGGVRETEAPVQYADYCEWQHELEISHSADRASETALDVFANGVANTCDWACGPKVRSTKKPISSGLASRVREYAAREKAGPADVFLATWALLLARITGERDVVIGCAYDGRTYTELVKAMGLFTTIVPVGVRVDPTKPFDELVRQSNRGREKASDLQESFSRNDLRSQANAANHSCLRWGFDIDDRPKHFAIDSLKCEIVDEYVWVEPARAQIALVENESGVSVRLTYDEQHLSPAEAEGITDQFLVLLTSAVAEPGRPVSELEMMGEPERRCVVEEWNATAAEYRGEESIHGLIERQAARSPEACAVRFRDQAISYRELNRRANRLAHYLSARGVRPDAPVGLCLERSIEMVTGQLAILKAGGAYVPLDPASPPERLAGMIADAGIQVIVTSGAPAYSLPHNGTLQVVHLEAEAAAMAQMEETNPTVCFDGERLVYVLYTSGSTGRPKGVMISHQALSNHMQWMQQRMPLTSADRVLQ